MIFLYLLFFGWGDWDFGYKKKMDENIMAKLSK